VVDMHGASGVNSSHFLVVGGPGAYVGMSSAEVSKMNLVSVSLPLFSLSFVLTSPSPVSYFAFSERIPLHGTTAWLSCMPPRSVGHVALSGSARTTLGTKKHAHARALDFSRGPVLAL
jgi:hypothetical protein